MKKRRPPNRAAQTAAIARKQAEPARSHNATVPTPRLGWSPARTAPQDDQCPVCGADVQEEGGLGCCGAITATCEGSLNGVPIDWAAVQTDEESDRLVDLAETHDWYVDTRQPAPPEGGGNGVRCRCEQPA